MQASEPARGATTAAPPGPAPGDTATAPAPLVGEDAVAARGPERFSNRELSWLEFGARLLDLADDERTPLLERVKFLAIFSEGLDEFFQVRVAGLKDQVDAGLRTRSADGLRPSEALRAIGERVTELVHRQSAIFVDSVVPALAEAGVRVADWSSLDEADRQHLTEAFNHQIFPVLTPLSVDPGHPFPYISNLSLNLIVRVGDPITGVERVARVKVPPLLPRFVVMPDGERFVALEQIIAAQLGTLFPDMVIGEHYAFRVTRNADLVLDEDEADDLLAAVEMELRRRRFGRAVRLEVAGDMSDDMRDMLVHELDLAADDSYDIAAPLDLGGLWGVYELDRPDLHEEAWAPMTPPRLANAGNETADLFAVLRERDVLVHHPYDSFTTSVEAFIAQAAADPDVLAIKQTLYRTSGDSPIAQSLIQAAEAGKQVAAVVELKARFDEQANILWARALEEAGVHVVYGLVGLKTHSKAALVVRREEDGIRRYCHVGTGNYNPRTARQYEDIGLLSADPDLGADVGDLFNFLTGYSRYARYRKLVVAPMALRQRITELIEQEAQAGPAGRIAIKVNGLTDPDIIDSLYRASMAGVPIDLVVRGVCNLRPGVPRPVGLHPGAVDRGPVPGALPDLPLRWQRVATADPAHRVRRPHGAQPRPAHRGPGPGPRPRAPGPAARGPRPQPERRHQLLGPRAQRGLDPRAHRGGGERPAPHAGAGAPPGPAAPRSRHPGRGRVGGGGPWRAGAR